MNRKRYSKTLIFALLAAFIFPTNHALAKSVTFQREYTYQASEADSKLSCRAIAVEQVKRLLLEELGTYLETQTEVKNYQLTKDQITTLTAGIVQTEIVDEKWDGKEYRLKAEITADPDKVAKSLDDLRKDRQKTKQLQDLRKKAEQASQEIEQLKSELVTLKGKEKYQVQSKYDKATDKLTSTDWAEKGVAFFGSREYEKAIAAFSTAIKLDPNDASSYFYRGSIYHVYLRMPDKAIADFDKAIPMTNKYIEMREDTIKAAYKDGPPRDKRFKEIMSENNDQIIGLKESLAGVHLWRGEAYFIKGHFDKAIADFNKTIELEPTNAEAYHHRGMVYVNKNQFDRAIADFNKAIEIDSNIANTYLQRGIAYGRLGQYDRGVADFNKALELEPTYATAYLFRGFHYDKLGYYQKAIKDWSTAARSGNKLAQQKLRSIGIQW
jgi:tetratricopeptide (TPR) repeat protein